MAAAAAAQSEGEAAGQVPGAPQSEERREQQARAESLMAGIDRAIGQLSTLHLTARGLQGLADAGSGVALTELADCWDRVQQELHTVADLAMREQMTLGQAQRRAARELAGAGQGALQAAQALPGTGDAGQTRSVSPASQGPDTASVVDLQQQAQNPMLQAEALPAPPQPGQAQQNPQPADGTAALWLRMTGIPRAGNDEAGADGPVAQPADAAPQAAAAAAPTPATPVPTVDRAIFIGNNMVMRQAAGQAVAHAPPTAQGIFAAADIRLQQQPPGQHDAKGKGQAAGKGPGPGQAGWAPMGKGKGKMDFGFGGKAGPGQYGKPGPTAVIGRLNAKAQAKGHPVRNVPAAEPIWCENSRHQGYKLRVGDLEPDITVSTARGLVVRPLAYWRQPRFQFALS
jgi:hypothetical protein